MRNLLTVISLLLVLGVSWFVMQELKANQERMDILLEKVQYLEDNINEGVSIDEEEELSKNENKVVSTKENVVVEKPKARVEKKNKVIQSKKEEATETVTPTPAPKEIKHNDIVITQFKKNFTDSDEIITFKNNTSGKINRIKGIIVYKDMGGNDISYNEIDIKLTIAPGMSKQTKIRSFDQDHKYCYHKEYQSFMEVSGITSFKIEFKLESYN